MGEDLFTLPNSLWIGGHAIMKKERSSGSIRKRPLSILIVLMIMCMISGGIIYASSGLNTGETAKAAGTTLVTDASSMDGWKDIAENNTKYIGRVWTDKSVFSENVTLSPSGITVEKGDSDFMVALSAISSTSNITTTMDGMPLDIVMVLDTSGSMGEDFGDEEIYAPTYDTGAGLLTGNRYVLDNGEYKQLTKVSDGWFSYHWELDGNRISFKTSASDNDPDHYQMYILRNATRMDSLKEAVGNFIDETVKINNDIADTEDKHHISIVSYAEGSNIVAGLQECSDDNKQSLMTAVDNLNANGSTYADSGMDSAKTVLSRSRDNAKKVVIFFTDGEPNHGNGFDGSVANDAIGTAKELKDDNALIYTIGIFDGANPNGNNDVNNYMNAMSSNYPEATSYNNLGQRVSEEAAYYKVADNADALNNIFTEISEEIVSSAGYPTQIEKPSGDPVDGTRDGYITFTDRLGDYMEVDGFKTIVFASQRFDLKAGGKTTDGNTDTYTFEGTAGNTIYPNGDLNTIEITVEHGKDLKEGDLVTVKIPASMIPLRDFDVDSEDPENPKTTVNETYPIRLFYGVSLKDGVKDALNEPDSALAKYISENSEDGKVSFYTNAFSKGAEFGDTVAEFTPAANNSYYYFTEDSYLFSDPDGNRPITGSLGGQSGYYYQRSYYNVGTGKAETYSIDISGSGLQELLRSAKVGENGQYYIPAGTPRLTTVTDMHDVKADNRTETASDIADQRWNDMSLESAEDIVAYLGNNGRMYVDLPGTLKVTKDIDVVDGFDAAKYKDTEFEFSLDLSGADEEYNAKIFDRSGDQQGRDFLIKDGDTFKLKAGESIYIYGLPDGASYEVTEQNIPAGFTQTSAEGAQGDITGGEEKSAEFLNTYSASLPDSVDTSEFFAGAKVLDGRDWKQGDSFLFVIEKDDKAPATEKAETRSEALSDGQYTDGQQVPFDFGEAEFTKPGTYTYIIYEKEPDSKAPGLSYSQALYTVTVEVTDSGDGTLDAEATMVQTTDDDAKATGTEADKALITNRYDAESIWAGPNGNKIYTDLSGGSMPLSKCDFSFRVTPLTQGAPIPADVQAEQDGSFTVTNDGTSISYGRAEFTAQHDKDHYDYLLEEVIPQGADESNQYTYKGMKYDPAKYIVRFSPEVQGSGDDAVVTMTITYWNTDDGVNPTTQIQADRISFTNSYKPEAAELSGDDAIHGEKTLNGRDMKDGETFNFKLKSADTNTDAAIAAGQITIDGWDEDSASASCQLTGAKNGEAKDFSFGSIKFDKTGIYKFVISEEQGNAKGVDYDKHKTYVTVEVTDQDGQLVASAQYDNGEDQTDDKAVFVNTYSSSLDYGARGGIRITKTLDGRDMKAGEFEFSITAEGNAPVGEADKKFFNASGREGEAISMMKLMSLKFTEDDAGKTYVYIVDEADKAADNGVTYDKSQYKVEISVSDPGQEGNLTAETTITRIMTSEGEADDTLIATYDTNTGGTPQIDFKNSYKPASKSLDTDDLFTKTLRGREWLDSDEFNFKIAAETKDAPLPDSASEKVTEPASGQSKNFGFGDIVFEDEGVYVYKVTEEAEDIPGITYSSNVATLTVNVTDNEDGTLSVSPMVVSREFVNVYNASMDYEDAGGLDITKTLTGRDMEEGIFEFTLKGADDLSRKKLGISEEGIKFYNTEAGDGEKATILSLGDAFDFSTADDGKTYTYEVSEKDSKENGYTYDTDVRTIKITVADKHNGKLEVTTVITGDGEDEIYTYVTGETPKDRASVDFSNKYEASTGADGAASLGADKELTGRPLKDKEFSFEVKTKDDTPETVMTGTNDAKGGISFDKKFEYTGSSLDKAVKDGYAMRTEVDGNYVWTLNYTVYEDTSGFDSMGLTGSDTSYDFTVTVKDEGNGKLKAEVNYPAGEDHFTFKNTYSVGGPVSVNIKGSKALKAEAGLMPPDIDGAYKFKITGEDENTPMPDNDTAYNDKDGNVVFGDVEFDLSMLEGTETAADGSRTREFKYKVSEEGTLPGVINDSDKEFSIILKDDGRGVLTATCSVQGPMFAFSNEYKITKPETSSITDAIEITKNLEGADISEYEFSFELLEGKDVVAEGKSDSSGKVVFDSIEYTEPGTHHYIVSEVNDGIKGITYDTSRFEITTEVTDNRDGTLTVEHSLKDGQSDGITFENKYEITQGTSVTLGASKILSGADLAKGQFRFELLDENGDVMEVAKNDENGVVMFGEIYYDAEGTFEYTVREVNDGQKDITYDDKTYNVSVKVEDVDSVLQASVESDDMIFTNIFTGTEDKGEENTPKTGDDNAMAPWLLLALAAMTGTAAIVRRKDHDR